MMLGNLQHQNRRPQTPVLTVLLLISAVAAYPDEAPQIVKVRLKNSFFEVDSRYEVQERTSTQTGTRSYYNKRLDVRPKVHLDLDGSVYHPKLFEYDLSIELGQSYEKELLLQPGSLEPERRRTDTNPLQFYNGRALILKEKALSGNMYGNYNLIRLDNGFFSRRLLYQTTYGAGLNYSGEVLPWSLTAEHREEEETDTRTPRDSMQDELNFKTSNQRGSRGQTTFDYLLQDFIRKDFNAAPYAGIRNSMRLNDSSNFLNEHLQLGSYLYYNDINSISIPSSTLTLRELLTAHHTDSLKSIYAYTYGAYDSGSTESVNQTGRVSLQHELFDSLTSTASADLRDSDQASADTFRYGFSLDEAYTKQIGDSSRLNLGADLSSHKENRQSGGGATIPISNEPHTLTTGQLTFLNQPNVIASSISVTDPSGTVLYSELIDYLVIQQGSLTEIQRVVGGNIPNGGNVLVNYSIVNQGTGSFTTQKSTFRFRYSLYQQLISVYGHLRVTENEGGEQFTLEDLAETVLGIESIWNWLNVGAEYENYNSSLLPTESVRFFQNLTFSTSWRSMLRISAEQSWISYPETDEEIQRYFHNIAFHTQLTSQLSFKVGGSLYLQSGQKDKTLDRELLAANTELNYRVGKTFITATYEYRTDNYLNEMLGRNTAYLRLRRMF